MDKESERAERREPRGEGEVATDRRLGDSEAERGEKEAGSPLKGAPSLLRKCEKIFMKLLMIGKWTKLLRVVERGKSTWKNRDFSALRSAT